MRIEFIATVVIGLSVIVGGRALLAELAQPQLAGIASLVLFALSVAQGLVLVRSLGQAGELARLVASRDITGFIAVLFAIVAVLTRASWSIGATITAVEFVLVLECMRLYTQPQDVA